jgi:hypothetical protein
MYCPLLMSMQLTCREWVVGYGPQKKGQSALPNTNCQGQLQTPQSVTVEGTALLHKCLCRVHFYRENECHDILNFEPVR